MIIYLFNQPFPDNSGFGRRCEREVKALSCLDEITVVCREDEKLISTEDFLKSEFHPIRIIRYSAKSAVVHRPDKYKSNGFYELKRNLDVIFNLVGVLIRVFRNPSSTPKRLYCVTSPLTIPFLGLILARIFRVEPRVVSFHDLEPELAQHLKGLSADHWIVKIELLLEAIVCRGYKKILVTTEAQAVVIQSRTAISSQKLGIIQNSSDISSLISKTQLKLPGVNSVDFILAYMSTISFDYTIEGLKELLKKFAIVSHKIPRLKIVIIGDGEGLKILKSFIRDHELESKVYCLGHLDNPSEFLSRVDAVIVPWKKDIMTETMLPTKLFEYLSLKLPVLAPNFGEFKKILTDQNTALLFNSFDEVFEKINSLIDDRKLAKKIGVAGNRLFLAKYSPEILNQKFISFYQA